MKEIKLVPNIVYVMCLNCGWSGIEAFKNNVPTRMLHYNSVQKGEWHKSECGNIMTWKPEINE